MMNRPAPIPEKLLFDLPSGDTGDLDESIIAPTMMEPAGAKVTDVVTGRQEDGRVATLCCEPPASTLFLPLLELLARGEPVTVEDLGAAMRRTRGDEAPTGRWRPVGCSKVVTAPRTRPMQGDRDEPGA
jgi:hypothetical protein